MIQAARDISAVQYKYRMQLTRSRLSGDENLCPRTDERHLLQCSMALASARASSACTFNSSACTLVVLAQAMSIEL